VVFVNGRTKKEIIPILKSRILNTREDELETGLTDMILIARSRCEKLLAK
jgi:2-oxo-4-hydroxy-4-carboxy-5-ureidoimidazoline decarboxylase